MPRAARRARVLPVALAPLLVALAILALTGRAPTSPAPSSDIGCPAGFSDAVAQRAVLGGTPTARVQVVPPSWLAVPIAGPLRNACVLRVSYRFQPTAGVAYQAMTPGDADDTVAIAATMLRSGWAAADLSGRMIGPGGRTARLTLYGSARFLAGLPQGFRMPPDSSYARDSVAVLTIVDPRER